MSSFYFMALGSPILQNPLYHYRLLMFAEEEAVGEVKTRMVLRKGNNIIKGMKLFQVDPTIQTSDSVDTEDLNYSKYIHAATESLPHIVIQYMNSSLLGSFNLLSILSIVVSAYQLVGTLFPLLFHKCNFSFDHQDMVDIPVRVPFTDIIFPPKKKKNVVNCWFYLLSLFNLSRDNQIYIMGENGAMNVEMNVVYNDDCDSDAEVFLALSQNDDGNHTMRVFENTSAVHYFYLLDNGPHEN